MIPCGCCATVSPKALAARLRAVHHQHAIGGPRRAAATIDIASDARERRQDADGLRQYFVITNPVAQHAIILDHIKQEARVIPIPPMQPMPKPPQLGMPGPPGTPTPPPMTSVDLGKGFIEGHPVTGTQLTFHMPTLPQAPGMPKAPGMPQAPGAPKAPGAPTATGAPAIPGAPSAPGMPKPPAMPTVAETWTSTSLHMPVLTKITGSFGQRTCYCKNAPTAEPHPSAFQIPPGYSLAK